MADSPACVPDTVVSPKKLSRPEAIARLRERLKALADEDSCVCKAVGELGIFCEGFKRLSDEQIRTQFDWIARRRPGTPREKLEELANLYHSGRKEATGAEICCDLETREHVACDGWNGFDNRRLEGFYLSLLGEVVQIG
jgi:hypothetical protein